MPQRCSRSARFPEGPHRLCIVADEETGGQGGSHYLDKIGLWERTASPCSPGADQWRGLERQPRRRHPANHGEREVRPRGFAARGDQCLRADAGRGASSPGTEGRGRDAPYAYRIVPEEAAHSILMLAVASKAGRISMWFPKPAASPWSADSTPRRTLDRKDATLLSSGEAPGAGDRDGH